MTDRTFQVDERELQAAEQDTAETLKFIKKIKNTLKEDLELLEGENQDLEEIGQDIKKLEQLEVAEEKKGETAQADKTEAEFVEDAEQAINEAEQRLEKIEGSAEQFFGAVKKALQELEEDRGLLEDVAQRDLS